MEIHQLHYVLAVEKFKHFTLAADEICVSQSTLSHQIKKLEEELGVKLFVRTTRAVSLTSAGEDFVRYARTILTEIERARNTMYEHTNLQKGTIKIGAIRTITLLGFTSVIAEFQKTYPGISVELYEANSDELIKKLHTAELDVAFITSPYQSSHDWDLDFEFYPLIHDELALFISRSHVLASKKVIDISDIAQEKFLVMKSSSSYRKALIDICREAAFKPNIVLESSQYGTIRGLVEEGIGVAFFSKRIAASILSPKTCIVELPKTVKRIAGLAISRTNNLLVTEALKDFVLKASF